MAHASGRRALTWLGLVALGVGFVTAAGVAPAHSQTAATPASRAVAYLKTEVPRWRREHSCYSCHNNGDAARALLTAARRGHALDGSVDDTLSWLASPDTWDRNAGRGGSADLPLGRIQFASALVAALDAGRATPQALTRAAELVASHQGPDGSWTLDATQTLGGATFYGRTLATAMARRVLGRAPAAWPQHVTRADAWLRSVELTTVTDAAAVLIGLGSADDAAASARSDAAVALLAKSQGPDGGWGPYVTSPSEAFDTALVLWALAAEGDSRGPSGSRGAMARRARNYLVDQQQPDGSWPETTRPSGGESYAQRISTTAWALLALLETE